ncbi:MAG: hypothetical protein GX938_09245 [Spirochaetales bacterium]|jgi:hypothetical protein|nr:hypothetical protein [Spirochaetales bacterium]
MPRQTNEKRIIFPDGFRMELKPEGAQDFTDVGVLAGGGVFTYNWEERKIDAGNYEDLVDEAFNPTVAFAPSALLNFDPAVIAAIFPGFLETTVISGGPYAGEEVDYAGTNRFTLKRATIKLTHYNVDATGGQETDANIDWQFTLYNATVDSGGTMNFKGLNEEGLNEITVSFTAKPDAANASRLLNFFLAAGV